MTSEKEKVGLTVSIDGIPNLIRSGPAGKETAKGLLMQRFENKLESMVNRYESLGLALHPAEPSFDRYLHEARDLFVEGFHWGAIALCGMAIESICADIISERVQSEDRARLPPTEKLREQIDALKELGVFKGPRTTELMHEILDTRNDYVHLRRPQPDGKEVQKAFQMLRLVVFAEFGLVPSGGANVRPSELNDIEQLTKELGL